MGNAINEISVIILNKIVKEDILKEDKINQNKVALVQYNFTSIAEFRRVKRRVPQKNLTSSIQPSIFNLQSSTLTKAALLTGTAFFAELTYCAHL